MARKSKKIIQPTLKIDNVVQGYNVAVYLRLSIEEKRDRKDSNSLEYQKSIIYDYIENNSDMKVFSVYCDNGETGTNFQRPEFQRMMYDVYNGKVNCIIVKDLSRFGREYIEAGEYIERIFPLIGIRFIAINDNYDNKVQSTDIIVPIKNVINTLYAKDMSKKSAAALRIKQANGEFIGSYASYGYVKSTEDKHKIVIDEYAAKVVKQIFEWKAEGFSYASICRKLYDRKIMPPARYRYDKGIIKDKRSANSELWADMTLKNMLTNQVYLGHMVQGRRKSHFYEGKKEENVSKEEFVIVKNTHKPIVSQELFDKVQAEMNNKHTSYYEKLGKYNKISSKENIFKGKIFCGDCKTPLIRYKTAKENYKKANYSFICPMHSKMPQKCDFIKISETILKQVVSESIGMQISSLIDFEKSLKAAKKLPEVQKKRKIITEILSDTYANLSYLKESRIKLVSDYAKDIVCDDDYELLKSEYDNNINAELKKIEATLRKRDNYEKVFDKSIWIKNLLKHQGFKKLTAEIIGVFIESITVYSNMEINIKWTFSDEYIKTVQLLEVCNEG